MRTDVDIPGRSGDRNCSYDHGAWQVSTGQSADLKFT